MPHATTDDGIRLYYEETGAGTPLIFVHEFAGDTRSWEPQVRHFARRYRCITFNARGYPPSDVPQTPSQYSQTPPRRQQNTARPGQRTTRALCWTTWRSHAAMWWACPWVGSRPSTSASG